MFQRSIRKIHHLHGFLYGRIAQLIHPVFPLPPSKLSLLVTTRCNMRCGFCYLGKNLNKDEPERLSLEEWEKIIDSIPKTTAVCLTGGEPFLFADFHAVVGMLLKRKRFVSIVSNGSKLTEKDVRFFVENRLFYLMFSLHGMADHHNAIPGHKGSFEKIRENIELISRIKAEKKSRYPLVSIKTVISNENIEQIPQIIELCENNPGVDDLYFNLMSEGSLHTAFEVIDDLESPHLHESRFYRYAPEKRPLLKKLYRDVHELRKRSRIDIGFTNHFKSPDEFDEYVDHPEAFGVNHCNKPWHEVQLYYNGMVGPCVGYDGGHIKDVGYDIRKIPRLPRYRKFLDFHLGNMPDPKMCDACMDADFSRRKAR